MKGSLTVEASLLLSILLLILAWLMKQTLYLYEDVVQTAVEIQGDIPEPAEHFRNFWLLRQIGEQEVT